MAVTLSRRGFLALVTPPELLAAHIAHSGLSITVYAREVVLRERRTVQRWLDGSHPIPIAVRSFLEGWRTDQQEPTR